MNTKTYLFKYYHDGSWWQLEMPGTSMEDAQARVKKLSWAQPCGELMAVIPARLGWLAKAGCWVRNAIYGASQ